MPCSSGSLLYVWCTLITIEPDSHMQQRVVSILCAQAHMQLGSFLFYIVWLLWQYVSLMVVVYESPVSGGFQSAVCHEEPLARSSHRPYREEESRTEREPIDTWTGPPGAPVKH